MNKLELVAARQNLLEAWDKFADQAEKMRNVNDFFIIITIDSNHHEIVIRAAL